MTADKSQLTVDGDIWGDWVECTSTHNMIAATENVMCEIRFDADGHVMAYRVARKEDARK